MDRFAIAMTIGAFLIVFFGRDEDRNGVLRPYRNIAAAVSRLLGWDQPPPPADPIAEMLERKFGAPGVGDDGFVPIPPR